MPLTSALCYMRPMSKQGRKTHARISMGLGACCSTACLPRCQLAPLLLCMQQGDHGLGKCARYGEAVHGKYALTQKTKLLIQC